jgi:hypothetical protein
LPLRGKAGRRFFCRLVQIIAEHGSAAGGLRHLKIALAFFIRRLRRLLQIVTAHPLITMFLEQRRQIPVTACDLQNDGQYEQYGHDGRQHLLAARRPYCP